MRAALASLCAAALLVAGPAVRADESAAVYPTKTIRVVVPFPPGGSSDAMVRIVVPKLSERLGQQVIVDNRPGAGGNIGLAVVAKAPPDGYTLGLGAAGGLAANVSLYANLPYDPVKDFVPISMLAHIPFVLVASPALPAKNLAALVAQAKAGPGKLAIGHGGNGTAMHLSIQLFEQMSGTRFNEVAYRGSGPAAVDVMGNQVPLAMVDLPSALAQIQAGKLRALAVTSEQRLASLPDVPTFAEAGVAGYESTGWFGFVAPAGTPPAIAAKLQAAVQAVVAEPDVKAQARVVGVELSSSSSADFGRYVQSEIAKWGKVIKVSGTKLE